MDNEERVFLNVSDALKERLLEYIRDRYSINGKTMENFINYEIEKNRIKDFLKKISSDEINVWRYINRIYITSFTSEDYNDLLNCDFDNKVVRVVAYPKDLERELLKDLEGKAILNPKQFTHLFYVLRLNSNFYYGLYDKTFFFQKPNVRLDNVSRAYYKIQESIFRFNISLRKEWRVLDVGAAPGGWVQFLQDKVSLIVAVDPGNLRIKGLGNIVHVKGKVEDSFNYIKRYAPFDLILCDINRDPRQVVRIINELGRLLVKDGYLIMTIKLIFKGSKYRDALIEEVVNVLKEKYKEVNVLWLLSNSKYERTLLAKKR